MKKGYSEEKRGNLEDAAYVWWGRNTIPYLHCLQETEYLLHDKHTPETILIEKDSIQKLSKECLLMAKTIMNLPEEMFHINGKLKKMQLRKVLKQKTGWSTTKIEKVKSNLAQQLLDISNGEILIPLNY
jgi:hypothetical protein